MTQNINTSCFFFFFCRGNESPECRDSRIAREGTPQLVLDRLSKNWRLPALPGFRPSTIGSCGLNFSVRYGKRWSPAGLVTFGSLAWPPFVRLRSLTIASFTTRGHVLRNVYNPINLLINSFFNSFFFPGSFGLLVPLGFDIATFTPAAYLRRRLRRPSWISHLAYGFALRCFQRLSSSDSDTRLCSWRNNRRTGGRLDTVLSY